jgi:hypothetical protein
LSTSFRARALCWLYAALLFAVNFVVAFRLFFVEFTQHMNSNEGTLMAISRFLVERWPQVEWFPRWFNGLPFENTYSPLLPIAGAVVSRITHRSPAATFHTLTALFYCLGPVFLFLLLRRISGKPHSALLACLFYSLFSPSVLFPAVLQDVYGWRHARRLHTLVHYGEGAHNIALSLLPLALLCAFLALTTAKFSWRVATGIVIGLMVLTNAFSITDLGFALGALVLSLPGTRRNFLSIAAIGAAAYVWISPLMSPRLVLTLQRSARLEDGFHFSPTALAASLLLMGVAAAVLYRTEGRIRWLILLTLIFTAIPALKHIGNISLVPQPLRYHLEMEMVLSVAAVFAAQALLSKTKPWIGHAALALFLIFLSTQLIAYRRFARDLIDPIDVTKTAEYKIAQWSDQNMHGARMLAAGSAGTWLNLFSDTPQVSSGHDPFSHNWALEGALYAIYAGDGAGENDAANSIVWLKAFGCHAVTVPGPGTREAYRPFRNPAKFEGVLPLLWREDADSIYALPGRSNSLAHVIPDAAMVRHTPRDGLDLDEVRRYVAALDDPALPLADLSWESPMQARIHGVTMPGERISLQITYDSGWIANANGKPVAIERDGLGLMTLPCHGECDIDLRYDGGLLRKLCGWASAAVMALTAGWAGRRVLATMLDS